MKTIVIISRPLLLLFAHLTAVFAPECHLPTTDEVREGFNGVVNAHFRFHDDQEPAEVDLFDYNFNCLAVGSARDTYRSVAVTGTFFDLGPRNRTVQIDLICRQGSAWAASLNYTNVTESGPPSTDYCASCEWRPNVTLPSLCTECHPSCTDGIMYCTGEGADECCGFYEDNVCVAECPEELTNDTDFNCVCELQCLNGSVDSNCSACTCMAGYTGDSCNQEIDECGSNPCLHGSCVDGLNTFACHCDPGFTGEVCEEKINGCSPINPCINGGNCTDVGGNFSCSCPSGFSGMTCELNLDDCTPNPCENGGTCTDGINEYTCNCTAGFGGAECRKDINPCAANPCGNGTCVVEGDGGYLCDCDFGFTGSNCETDIDDCEADPCQNGTCVDGSGAYLCDCDPGYTGQHCGVEIDNCALAPCHAGSCIDLIDAFFCDCPLERTGEFCESCVDGFVLNQTGTCVKNCAMACSTETEQFLENVCVFYCELEMWYESAEANGLSLPAFEGRNASLSRSEQWDAVLDEWEKFSGAWRDEAEGQGVYATRAVSGSGSGTRLDVPDQPSLDAMDIELWTSFAVEHVFQQTVWEEYIQTLVPSFPITTATPLKLDANDIEGSSQDIFDNLLSNWTLAQEA